MKRVRLLFIGICLMLVTGASLPAPEFLAPPTGIHMRLPGLRPGWLGSVPDPNPDENEPDKSAWQVFIAINKAAPSQHHVGPNNVATNDALWETWADDPLTFPAHPDLAHPPQWPSTAATFPRKRLTVPLQNLFRRLQLEHNPQPRAFVKQLQLAHPEIKPELFLLKPGTLPGGTMPQILEVQIGGGEEVRRNKAAFDFIIGKKLWYTQGLAAAFAAGDTIVFPVDAIEVKARWKPITEAMKPQYHWNYDANGNLYGLTALHIMTKALPNWTWATWEWTGNPGRCDYIGCKDEFGMTPADVAPKTPLGGTYPAGTQTSALLALFNAAGLSAEWTNYRLKGTQTLFADTTAQPTLLGNSVTEAGFVQSSSCITCHGQAAVDKNGAPNPTIGFTPSGQSTNGPLLPSMFWVGSPPVLTYLPIDFVWAILNASPAP